MMHMSQSAPPQSASVSRPLRTPSVQLGARQNPFTHTPLSQSATAPQSWPGSQPRQSPPQSTSLSLPFRTLSSQPDAAQSPAVQTPESQSVASPQTWPAAHVGHSPPPQSMPVSVPLSVPSKQVAGIGAQTPSGQKVLRQSAPTEQSWPSAQGAQEPPQSTSLSSPFATVSLQLAAAQVPVSQTPLSQSEP